MIQNVFVIVQRYDEFVFFLSYFRLYLNELFRRSISCCE